MSEEDDYLYPDFEHDTLSKIFLLNVEDSLTCNL